MESGSLNLLKPSGPVQARTGIALPVSFITFKECLKFVDFIILALLVAWFPGSNKNFQIYWSVNLDAHI
jgi:hypothetical protein